MNYHSFQTPKSKAFFILESPYIYHTPPLKNTFSLKTNIFPISLPHFVSDILRKMSFQLFFFPFLSSSYSDGTTAALPSVMAKLFTHTFAFNSTLDYSRNKSLSPPLSNSFIPYTVNSIKYMNSGLSEHNTKKL